MHTPARRRRSARAASAPRWRRPWALGIAVASAVGLALGIAITYSQRPNPPIPATPAAAAQPERFSGVKGNDPAGDGPNVLPPTGCGDLDSVLATMSRRDKLAQLLMVGVTDEADARAVVTKDHVGGIFIGSWTDRSILSGGALKAIAATAGSLNLAVSVDEEGGRVSRLSSLLGAVPSARQLAATVDPEQVYELALARGRKMRELGITVDFAPVVDVTAAPDDTVIGDRSFSADPDRATLYAGAFARGLREAGVLPVLKHFPGHGRASGDSHTGAVTAPAVSDLHDIDLVPYRTLVTTSPAGVMVGHMEVPGLTDGEPASLSPAAYQLLRTGTGYDAPPFDGPVFTDDLSSMRAVSERYGVAAAVLKALQAGADIALWISTDQVPAVLDRLEAAIDAKDLDLAKVDLSVRRIAAVKGLAGQCRH